MVHVTANFKQIISVGPAYACCTCHRLMFKHQVVHCIENNYHTRGGVISQIAKKCLSRKYLHSCTSVCSDPCCHPESAKSLWICYTCHRKILSGKIPAEAAVNNLELTPIPEELACLNKLENHLIALHIPFVKMMTLPKGGQYGVHGPMVCVPSNIHKITDTLPRLQADDQTIRVKLKRKLSYKGHYQYQFVNKHHLQDALNYLKENNKWYADIVFNNDWDNTLSEEKMRTTNPTTSADRNDTLPNSAKEESTQVYVNDDSDMALNPENIVDDANEEDEEKLKGMLLDTCLQPVDIGQEVLDQHFDSIVCIAPAQENSPVSILMDEGNEAKSFPGLFPAGSPTFTDNREERITLGRYLHCRLMNADNRFASNTDYIFYAQYLSEVNQVVSNVSIALRKGRGSGKKLTNKMLTEKDALQDLFKSDEGYKFLRPIRGTPPFWQSSQKDLFAMIRQLGIPTWFCSFSSADMRWSELIEAILKQHGDNRESNELDWSEKCEILRSNPVTAARMFDNRFRNFLKNVIMSPAQPIGKIKDYFYRVEFQQRGSPHTHCIIWVEDAPKYDKDDDETVATFVDRYISCRLPDKDEDEELHEIVSSVQKHSPRHSKSCKKRGTTCRFNFPKPPSKATFVCRISGKNGSEQTSRDSDDNNEGESGSLTREDAKLHLMALWEALADTSKAYESVDDLFSACNLSQALFKEACQKIAQRSNVVLQRRPQDIWINQYNEDLIRCWNANMDIQYVFDAYSCVVYIVSYISKSESEMGLLLDHAQREARQDGNIGAKAAMRQLGSVYLHNREISAQEAVYRVCNLRLKEGSRKVQFIPIGDEPIKCSLPLCVLQQKGTDLDDDDEIWMTNLVERYKARPKEGDFLNMCLATFASEYRVLAKSQVANLSDKSVVYELENGLGFVQKRTRTNPAVVRYPRFSITNSPEKYYQGILQLFLPYHLDTHLKPPGFERYEDFYQMAAVCMCNKTELVKDIVNANRSMFEIEAECIDQAQETLQIYGPLEDAWAQICPETELERLDCLQTKVSITGESDKNDDIPDLKDLPTQKQQYQTELNISIIPQSVAKPLLRSLNKDQSDMFYYIREWCLNKVHGKKPEPFHIFVTGGAGVGKSHLIKSIYYESTRVLAPTLPNPDDVSVLMVAPTGVAAFNIGATTIHSAFKIGIEAKLPYKPLGEDKINSLRAKLGSLELLIIDEISMVDHKLLCYIHGRLRQIKQSQDYSPFGKISVLAVGDFYQLPPVKGRQLCINSEGVNLWQDLFCIYELKVIMRQKDDLKFAQTLNRLRTRKKADALNPDDELSLRSCETGEESDAIHMFSTNAEVDEHNLKSLFARCSDPICIEAQDFSRDPRTRKMQKRNMPHARVFNTNLSKTVSLGEGARVMLTKNIDVSDGLVNGVFGTITKIVLSSSDTLPTVIYVLFDDKRVGQKLRKEIHMPQSLPEDSIPIEPQEDTINNSGGIRRQFPLKLAWACTVHKVQGLTVDNGVVSLDRIFAPGQAYVALSRVSTIDGLIVQDFKEQAIYCNEKVEQALLCMPKFMKPSESKGCAGSTIMLHNIQGLIPHFEDLKHDTRFAEAHFICLTETWLKDNVETSKVELPNFTFHSNTRQRCYDESNSTFSDLRRQAHGGVGFYHDTNIMCEILALNATNIEYIAFSLPDKVLTIVVVYRPESYRTDVFITNLQILLDELLTITDVCIVMGDFNQNVLQRGLSIQQCMETNGYTQYVKNVTTEGGTLIDHVYVHGLNNIKSINVNVVPTYFSYHEAIRIEIT